MVDFSSVSLKIQAPNAPEVLDVLAKIDERGQRVAKSVGNAHKSALSDVSRHASLTARKVAGEISMIAAEGKISAGALKGITTEAANAAFMFGPYGAIAGAVALTGVAIFHMFSRTREEIEKTAGKAREELERMARAGDLPGTARASQYLFSGDPFAVVGGQKEGESDEEYYARRVGIQGVRKHMQQLETTLPAYLQNGKWREQRGLISTAVAELQKYEEVLGAIENRYNAIQPVLTTLMRKEGEHAKQVVIDLQAAERQKFDASHTKTLDDLLGKGLPLPNMLGASVAGGLRPDLTEFGFAVRAGIQEALKKVPPIPATEMDENLRRLLGLEDTAMERLAKEIGASFGQTLATTITTAIATAFQRGANIGNAFAALGGAVLQAIGGMFEQIGVAALAGMKFMATIKTAILKFAPELGIPAAIGLIALGAVLQGLGGRMGANSGVGGGSGGGYGGGSRGFNAGSIIDRGLVNPLNPLATPMSSVEARPSIVFAPTIIGTTDARAQSDLVRMVELGLRRSGRQL